MWLNAEQKEPAQRTAYCLAVGKRKTQLPQLVGGLACWSGAGWFPSGPQEPEVQTRLPIQTTNVEPARPKSQLAAIINIIHRKTASENSRAGRSKGALDQSGRIRFGASYPREKILKRKKTANPEHSSALRYLARGWCFSLFEETQQAQKANKCSL